MNTVQRVPRSTGCRANKASSANCAAVKPKELAKFSRNEPQPEEQASFSMTLSTVPFFRRMHFMSCPPMSSTQSTCGSKNAAAVVWAMVSTSPSSRWKAAFSSASP